MAFTRFTKNVLNVSALPDRVQNQAQTLKATFDQAGADNKEAHNLLIDELEAITSAESLGAKDVNGEKTTVQAELESIRTSVNERVEKVEGKQLSTEDYTTEEKTKLASIAEGANNYVLPEASTTTLGGIKVDGSTIVVENGVAKAKTADSADYTARAEIEALKSETEVKVSELQTSINDIAPSIDNVETSVNKLEGDLYSQDRYNLLRVTAEETKMVDIDGFVLKTSIGNSINAVATDGNGTYVSVGQSGYIATSTDLTNWTKQTSGTSYHLYDVTYGDGVFIAVGQYQSIYKSTDGGVTWTQKFKGSSSSSYGSYSVAYGNGGFMVGGNAQDTVTEHNLYYSVNGGETWEGRDVGSGTEYLYIKFINNQFVITSSSANVYTSSVANGYLTTMATGVVALNSNHANDIIYANGYYVAGGYSALAISKDLRTWTQISTDNIKALIENDGQIIMGGTSSYLKSTQDFKYIKSSKTTLAVVDFIKEEDKIILFNPAGNVFESTSCLSEYKQYLDVPLTSYEKGKIVNIEGGRYISPTTPVQEDIIPKSWTQVTANTEYISADGTKLKASNSLSSTYPVSNACDGNVDTYWSTTQSKESWMQIEFPSAKHITKMKIYCVGSGSDINIKIQGGNDGADWIDLYVATEYIAPMTEVTLSNTDFYKFYRLIYEHTSPAYDSTYEWQVSEYLNVTDFVTTFYNPLININNLGEKQINGTIGYGQRYSLVYNGESWDIVNLKVVTGSVAVAQSSTVNIELYGAKFVIADIVGATPQYYLGAKLFLPNDTAEYLYSGSKITTATLSTGGNTFSIQNGTTTAQTINYVAFY